MTVRSVAAFLMVLVAFHSRAQDAVQGVFFDGRFQVTADHFAHTEVGAKNGASVYLPNGALN